MKTIFFFLMVLSVNLFAQEAIEVTYNKTTSLVFEHPIINVDRGSKDVLAQKVEGVENAIQVKAGTKEFAETNLTVFTADGHVYHFTVRYSDRPSKFTYPISSAGTVGPVTFSIGENTKLLRDLSDKIIFFNQHDVLASKSRFKLRFRVVGIYVHDGLVFFHLSITNKSNVRFDIESLRFFIEDNSEVKRTASQNLEIQPEYTHRFVRRIEGASEVQMIFALKKFTIPDAKHLDIELIEKDGGRNLALSLRNHDIMKVKRIF